MSKIAKRANKLRFEDGTIIVFNELPEGYFYKHHFYQSDNSCFMALLEDGEVQIHHFPNGTWEFNHTLYPSLNELYEENEDAFASPYNEFKSHYEDFGVTHNPINRTRYSYDRDEWNILFDTKGEVVMELRNETNLIETEEDREGRYLQGITKEECVAYFKKPIKERIKVLEEMK